MGNWLNYPGVTSTLGTFTSLPRPGRLWRILRTLRPFRRGGAWVNKLGLRNPGINWLIDAKARGKIKLHDKIVSIHGFYTEDWIALMNKVACLGAAAYELNVSCPNVADDSTDYATVFNAAADIFYRDELIIKLSPQNYRDRLEEAMAYGWRNFHCFNTIPVPGGGLSGKPLLALYPQMIADIRRDYGDANLHLIAGGGVSCAADVKLYLANGADHVAVGSMLFHRATRRAMRPGGEMAAAAARNPQPAAT